MNIENKDWQSVQYFIAKLPEKRKIEGENTKTDKAVLEICIERGIRMQQNSPFRN
jgi:hypothetical protein